MIFLAKAFANLHDRLYCALFGHWFVARPAEGIERCIACASVRKIPHEQLKLWERDNEKAAYENRSHPNVRSYKEVPAIAERPAFCLHPDKDAN